MRVRPLSWQSEALCGFKMDLKTLDDRKLLIKSVAGEVIKPVSHDPFREDAEDEWDMFEDADVPSLENAAERFDDVVDFPIPPLP